MSRVRIVGGGLTGILAAFQAHRLGARDITLYERHDQIGGAAAGRTLHGLEVRDDRIWFGGRDDPARSLLEAYGLRFVEFENRVASLSPGNVPTADFGGPALPAPGLLLSPPAGPSLADRLACYPHEVADALSAHARWLMGSVDLAQTHPGVAAPMGINRVFPTGVDLEALAAARRQHALTEELYDVPRGPGDRGADLTASTPQDGFPTFLRRARRALEAAGVRVCETALISPGQSLAERAGGDVLVWAASPTALFRAAGVPAPQLRARNFTTHVIGARWTGPLPFYVHNFTAEGICIRAYLYESGDRTLLSAQCVADAHPSELRSDLHRMTRPFGDLLLSETIATSVRPHWVCHTLDDVRRLGQLRGAMAGLMGPAFVPGGWELHAGADRFQAVSAALAAALGSDARTSSAA